MSYMPREVNDEQRGQAVNTTVCHPEGHGFEASKSGQIPLWTRSSWKIMLIIATKINEMIYERWGIRLVGRREI